MNMLKTTRRLVRFGLGLLVSASMATHAQTTTCTTANTDNSTGYDVFLLVGQSNMAGRGLMPKPMDEDGTPHQDILMWDGTKYLSPKEKVDLPIDATARIVLAKEPIINTEYWQSQEIVNGVSIIHNHFSAHTSMGMSFAKSYLKWIRANCHLKRRVLLVGAAWGGTGFVLKKPKSDGTQPVEIKPQGWLKDDGKTRTAGELYREAVIRANNALAAAASIAGGKTTRFAGILWHQGEHDISNNGGSDYAQNHLDLLTALRTEITGATNAPIVVGEMTPCFLALCTGNWKSNVNTEDRDKVLNYIHGIHSHLQPSAWVSSAGLKWNDDRIHYDTPSLRELGRRYFAKYWEAAQNLPSPVVDLKAYDNTIFNVGNSIDVERSRTSNDAVTPNVIESPRTTGNLFKNGHDKITVVDNTISVDADTQFGNVVKLTPDAVSLSTRIDGNLFNASYTKMAWIKLASYNGRNNIISANNPAQAHYLYTPNQDGVFAAGHSSDTKRIKSDVKAHRPLELDKWTHIAVTYDAPNKTMTMYIDGTAVDTSTTVQPATQTSGIVTLNIPGWMDTKNYTLNGNIISAKVYDSTLTSAQIQQIFKFEKDWQKGYGRP